MKVLFEGNTSKIGQIEALLLITGTMKKDERGRRIAKGKVISVGVRTNVLPWHEQRAFRSPVFTKLYLLTLDDRLRYFCRWFNVKFYYDVRMDYANMQVPAKEADKLKFLVEQGFNLLQQEKPEDAERIRQLLPKGILNSLEQKVVESDSGDGDSPVEEENDEQS